MGDNYFNLYSFLFSDSSTMACTTVIYTKIPFKTMEIRLQTTLWNTAKYSKMLAHDWFREMNLILIHMLRSFLINSTGKKIFSWSECLLIVSPFISATPKTRLTHCSAYTFQTPRSIVKCFANSITAQVVNEIFFPFSSVPRRNSELEALQRKSKWEPRRSAWYWEITSVKS